MPMLRDLSRASLELFQQLAAIQGLDFGFRQNGLLMLFRTRPGYEEGLKEAGSLREIGTESNVLSTADVRRLEPAVLPSVIGGVYFPQDAHLNPADFVRGLAHEAEELGVHICRSTEVLKLETSAQRISTVKTTRGDFWPDQVVLAGPQRDLLSVDGPAQKCLHGWGDNTCRNHRGLLCTFFLTIR